MKGKDKTKEQLMWELAEMRRRVAKLEASEAEYKRMELSQLQDVQRLFVQGPAVVFRWRAEEGWPIEYVSPNAEGQFGYRPDDSTSGRILYRDIIHPDDILHLFEELRECAKSGKEYLRQEYRIRSMDGIYRWVSDYTLLIKDDSGITTHYLGYITDITEHKRMGAELSASEEYYCTVFENTGTATVIIEEDAIISLVNEEFVSLSGYSKEELEGKKSWTEFVAKEDLVRMMQYQKSRGTNAGSAPRHYEFQAVDREGNIKDIFLTVALIPGTGKSVASLLDITGRKQAEEKLKMFSHATAGAIDGVAITDLEGNIIYANSAMEETYGYKQGELPGKPVFCLAAKAEVASEIMSAMIKTGSWVGEIEAIKGNEEIFPSALSLSMVRDDKGTPIAMMGASRDITERKKSEEALKESEGKLNSMLQSISDQISMMDKDLNILWANETTKRIFGEDIAGKKCYQVYHKRQKVCVDCPVLKAFEDSQNHGHETEVINKDGNVLYFQCTANVALRDKDGKPTAAIEISRDITERKQAEEERRIYLQGINSAFEGIAFTNMNGDILYLNKAACTMFGYTLAEMKQMNISQLSAASADRKQLEESVREDGGFHGEINGVRKNGETFPAMLSVSIFKSNEGKSIGRMGVFTDITEQKKAEAEKQELERKAQITNRLASVGEMAAGIAHEINNPLTGVVGFSELLLQKDLPDDIREEVGIICDGSKRVADIVKRLLTFARQHKPERSYTDINQIIESTLTLRRYALETGNIEVNTSLDAELPCTMTDRGQLQQVFMNIIVNAETEMKKAHGRGKLTIKTEQIDNKIRLSFADDGPGIARENIGKVFDPFFTTREVGEGTGMGLSLSYGIIREHKGTLYVKSRMGKGATFIIELPIIAEERQLGLAELAGEIKGVSGARILVVDDEPTILAFLKKVLGGEGYDVETVSSGREALKRIGNEEYSLILSDIKLPGLSGVELYEQIGKTAPSLQKRVMFITGDVTSVDTGEFLKRAKASYVTKPFDIAKLKEEVSRMLSNNS